MARPRKNRARTSSRERRVAVYAGSFDPPTLGHVYMIEQGARLFDELIVAIGTNPDKRYTFSLDDRLGFLRDLTRKLKNVRIDHFENRFLVDYAQSVKATYTLRGVRNAQDWEYERTMRYINADLRPQLTTVFLAPPRELAEISSSFVKGLVGPKGWKKVVKKYVPNGVYQALVKAQQKQ